jgi:hypothetical protein
MQDTDVTKNIPIEEAIELHQPFTKEEADAIAKRLDRFYNKLRKDFGGDRFDIYTATIQSIMHPEGTMTNLRGNMHTAQYAMAAAIDVLIKNAVLNMHLTKESLLLYCITNLADEVRQIWNEQQSPKQ